MALPSISGRVAWMFEEENFDIDQIIGIKNVKVTDVDELVKVAMRDYDPDFATMVKAGDVIVGGGNFGYGHPHYGAFRALRAMGVTAVVAESFSPGFWRGEISNGFPLIACPGILNHCQRWDTLEVRWAERTVVNRRTGATLAMAPIPDADLRMIETGGLVPFLKAIIGRTGAPASQP